MRTVSSRGCGGLVIGNEWLNDQISADCLSHHFRNSTLPPEHPRRPKSQNALQDMLQLRLGMSDRSYELVPHQRLTFSLDLGSLSASEVIKFAYGSI